MLNAHETTTGKQTRLLIAQLTLTGSKVRQDILFSRKQDPLQSSDNRELPGHTTYIYTQTTHMRSLS